MKNEVYGQVILTGSPSCDALYSFMTSSSTPSMMGVLLISRDGERKFPAPPRPVEKIYKEGVQ